ncbi:MAG: hypothetical protein Fur0025_25580 [Oscillatoriaceae cyanobacterium]
MTSPYEGLAPQDWEAKTRELIAKHPLDSTELYEVVLQQWDGIFESLITSKGYRIGIDFFPGPQIMGFLLHELIALELTNRHPGIWRREEKAKDKDLVYIPDDQFSIEIKTSSQQGKIFGNRSFTQKSKTGKTKKSKSGYYLGVNFEKFKSSSPTETETKREKPQITSVRFGWIDAEDWQGQKAATGQQARLSNDVARYKLLPLPLTPPKI